MFDQQALELLHKETLRYLKQYLEEYLDEHPNARVNKLAKYPITLEEDMTAFIAILIGMGHMWLSYNSVSGHIHNFTKTLFLTFNQELLEQ